MPEMNPEKASPLFELTFEGAWPTAVAFLGSGERLAAANREGQIFIWDLPAETPKEDAPAPTPVRQLLGHENGVTRLVATTDGKLLISASLDGTVRVWPMDAPAEETSEVVVDGNTREREAKKQRDESILTAPGVEVQTQTACEVLDAHTDWVNGLGMSRDETRLITGDDSCQTILWDLPRRKEIRRWRGHSGNWVSSAALTADGQRAFVAEYCSSRGSFDRPPAQARIYDATTGEEQIDLLKVQFPKVKARDNSYGYARIWGKFVARGFVAADFSPDGKLLAIGQGGETGKAQAHLIDAETGKLVRSVSEHQYGLLDVKFSPEGKYLLTTGRDTTLKIVQVADGNTVATLGKPRGGQFKDWFWGLALSPDSRRLAAADIAGVVHVWQLG